MSAEQDSVDRIVSLREAIEAAIDRSVSEWDLNYMEVVGVLEALKFDTLAGCAGLFGDEE